MTNRNILITGGAGFIGSHLVRSLVTKYPYYHIINLDALTYAGNLTNLKDVAEAPNYKFVKGDINDLPFLQNLFKDEAISDVIHLAAESHVDRSIENPTSFVMTNVIGTTHLLISAKEYWQDDLSKHLFYHISTDEVYGSLGEHGYFTELTPYDPRSPYSASKASSDHLVRAFNHTYGLRTIISNCSNNYGPNQFPEKLIPLMINNIIHSKPLPVYGKGENVRDWLWVKDHIAAIDRIFHHGKPGNTYNIGGNSEMKNIELVYLLCEILDKKLSRPDGSSKLLIRFVTDRPGHDKRYAIDATKLQNELKWSPSMNIKDGLEQTVDWYLSNEIWLNEVTSGAYKNYYQKHYSK
ncbi:MAG: dTDP-glucose 4,6-dehydratase [Saprospiraceae bacterium]|nr:dTDP-glucose 4,6-dehydratase [Candidatus Vicinibacter affinis]